MIERNIIFIHPLSQRLKELKDELEKDEENLIFEIDSLNEYGQVIGVLEHSISFSSDLKKTRSYLEDYSQLVKNKESKNILIQENMIAPHIFSKLQALGLNELLKEKTELKSLMHKIDFFFKGFDKGQQNSMMQSMEISSNKEDIDENFTVKSHDQGQKDAGLFNFDKKKKKKIPSFDHSLFSNFILKRNKTDLSFLDNPLSHYQRKAVAQFNPELPMRDLKRAKFIPVENELKRKYGKLDLPLQDLNKKKGLKFEPVQREAKKRGIFNEVKRELKPKRKSFDSVDREGKKWNPLEKVDREREKRGLEEYSHNAK